MQEIVAEFERHQGNPQYYVYLLRVDRALIGQLLACSKNPFLDVIRPLYTLSRRFWLAYEGEQEDFRPADITRYHIEIGNAVIRGDVDGAETLAREFLDFIEQFTAAVAHHL